MRPETAQKLDAWFTAVEETTHRFEVGDRYHTANTLAKKMNEKSGGNAVSEQTARSLLRKLVEKKKARLVGYNPATAQGGGRVGVYELVAVSK